MEALKSDSHQIHQLELMDFADFLVNSQQIFLQFYIQYFPLMSWPPWKFREILISISEDM